MQLHMDNSPDFSWLPRMVFTQCYLKCYLGVTTGPYLHWLWPQQTFLRCPSGVTGKIKSRKKYSIVSASLRQKMLKYCTPLQPRVSPVLTSGSVTAKLRPSTFSWQMTFSWLKLWYFYSWAPENKTGLIKICKGHEHPVPVGFFEQGSFFAHKW